MASYWQAARFFGVVRPVPRLTRAVFALITLSSGVALVTSSARDARVLLPILVLQMFTTSTGFITYARRGHFDVLLTGGVSRVAVALTYWALTAWPGIVCWATLAVIDVAAHGRTSLLSAGSGAAVIGISTIPWAITVPLNRFAGAIGWLLTLVLVTGLTPIAPGWSLTRVDDASPWQELLAFLLFPPRLVGEPFAGHGMPIVLMLTLALAGMSAALMWVARTDLALETGQ